MFYGFWSLQLWLLGWFAILCTSNNKLCHLQVTRLLANNILNPSHAITMCLKGKEMMTLLEILSFPEVLYLKLRMIVNFCLSTEIEPDAVDEWCCAQRTSEIKWKCSVLHSLLVSTFISINGYCITQWTWIFIHVIRLTFVPGGLALRQ